MAEQDRVEKSEPWWKFGHVWMVIAGPALVIVASFVTYYLAASGKDTLVNDSAGIQAKTEDKSSKDSLAPAVQARNHAATGVTPKP